MTKADYSSLVERINSGIPILLKYDLTSPVQLLEECRSVLQALYIEVIKYHIEELWVKIREVRDLRYDASISHNAEMVRNCREEEGTLLLQMQALQEELKSLGA